MKPAGLMDVLIKEEAETDPGYGCPPEKRDIKTHLNNGIVNIDKPAGPNSHQVTTWVKEILELDKTGHSGTLDPKVTGVLPVALGNATKIVKVLLLSDKEYICLMSLHDTAQKDRLEKIFHELQGPIFQTPPIMSAVKRELRIRNIYELKLLERDGKETLFRVRCEAGTYIRKLCHDIGIILGTGAHMHELRRTKAGPFDETSLIILQNLKDAYYSYKETGDETDLRKLVLPVEAGVKNIRKIWIKDSAIDAICHGADLNAPGISKLEKGINKNDPVALMSLKNELVALAKANHASEDIQKMQKGPAATLVRVIMETNTYPKQWHKNKAEKTV
jgi:H/ACA ribonucleoprotein complex subunit 4